MDRESTLFALVARARRRHATHVLIDQAGLAYTIALAGVCLLLLAGSQIFDARWLVVLSVAGVTAGAIRASRQTRSAYAIAQLLDRRLHLHDALSTAWYFQDFPEPHASFVGAQRRAAARAAATADVKMALPFRAPRTVYAALGMSLLCASLFAVRFGVIHTLDLRASLIGAAIGDVFQESSTEAVAKAKQGAPKAKGAVNPNEAAIPGLEPAPLDDSLAPDSVLRTVDEPDFNNPDSGGNARKADAVNEPAEKGDRSKGTDEAADDAAGADGGAEGKSPTPGAPQPAAGERKNASDKSSLLNKMRDAMANLLAKMSLQPKPGLANKAAGAAKGEGQQGEKKEASDKGAPGKEQGSSNAEADAEAETNGQTGESTQAARGKSGDRNSDRPASPDAKSGIGSQDGAKDAKAAEELAAMGKISEIIGKRSANLTGEVMVEVASGKQQLKTQYSGRRGAHSEAGGEINRDEVPLAYQQYVRQYFEEIRKLSSGARASH